MNIYSILEALKDIEEAANPAQQAAIAVAMKKAGKKPKNESDWDDDYESDEGDYVDVPGVHAQTPPNINRAGFNKLTLQNYYDKIDFVDRQLRDPSQQANWPEFKQRRQELVQAAQRAGLVPVKEGSKFPFANSKQKPGDQVRGTEKATKKKSGEHPFKGRLVGAAESVEEEKQRLDPKCWKGYRKQGTKVKGGVRVNNCVKVGEEWEQFVNEYGMTTGGMVSPSANSSTVTDPKEKAKQVAQAQQAVNKLKSAGANIPNVNQAVQSALKEPGKEPESQLDKTIAAGLGQEVEQLITKGDPNAVTQLAAMIKKVKQQGGA